MKNNFKIISAFILVMLLVIIGTSYAYFILKSTDNDSASTDIYNASNVKLIVFNGTINATGSLRKPGDQMTKTFTVKNNSVVPISEYYVKIVDVVNTFINTNDLTYIINCSASSGSCTGNSTPTVYPTGETNILHGSSIAPGVTHTYSLIVTYNDTSTDQSSDMNKQIGGKINVSY